MWRSIAPPVDVVAVAVSGAGADIGPGAVLNNTFHIFILHHRAPFVHLGEDVLTHTPHLFNAPTREFSGWAFPIHSRATPAHPWRTTCPSLERFQANSLVMFRTEQTATSPPTGSQ